MQAGNEDDEGGDKVKDFRWDRHTELMEAVIYMNESRAIYVKVLMRIKTQRAKIRTCWPESVTHFGIKEAHLMHYSWNCPDAHKYSRKNYLKAKLLIPEDAEQIRKEYLQYLDDIKIARLMGLTIQSCPSELLDLKRLRIQQNKELKQLKNTIKGV